MASLVKRLDAYRNCTEGDTFGIVRDDIQTICPSVTETGNKIALDPISSVIGSL